MRKPKQTPNYATHNCASGQWETLGLYTYNVGLKKVFKYKQSSIQLESRHMIEEGEIFNPPKQLKHLI